MRGIPSDTLRSLYVVQGKSASQIAGILCCSDNKVNYWLGKYGIKKRSISDEVYKRKNPLGDPFSVREPTNAEDAFLCGLGLGLYWGEGAKRGDGGVRLTNTDPRLILKFMDFIERMCGVKRESLRFSLQLFGDMSPENTLQYWVKELRVGAKQFYRPVISDLRGKGTYRHKSRHGVVIVYFNNVRLKAILCEMIDKIR
jgi:hypothetical protein